MGRVARVLVGGLVLLLVLLGVAHTAAWFWAMGQLERGFAAQLAGMKTQGWTVSTASQVRSGWPLAVALDLTDVVAARAAGTGPLTWRAAAVRVEVSALQPGTLQILPSGPQSIQVGSNPMLPYEAAGLRATVALDAPDRLAVQAASLSAAAPYELRVQDAAATFAPDAASVRAAQVQLPDSFAWVLGRDLAAVVLDVTWPGMADPSGPANGSGRVLIQEIGLHWGPMQLAGRGVATLQRAQLASAGGTLRVRGASETLAALRTAGVLTPGQATAAGAVLGLLLRSAGPGGEVEVPVALQAGVVSAAGIPLLRIPASPWLAP